MPIVRLHSDPIHTIQARKPGPNYQASLTSPSQTQGLARFTVRAAFSLASFTSASKGPKFPVWPCWDHGYGQVWGSCVLFQSFSFWVNDFAHEFRKMVRHMMIGSIWVIPPRSFLGSSSGVSDGHLWITTHTTMTRPLKEGGSAPPSCQKGTHSWSFSVSYDLSAITTTSNPLKIGKCKKKHKFWKPVNTISNFFKENQPQEFHNSNPSHCCMSCCLLMALSCKRFPAVSEFTNCACIFMDKRQTSCKHMQTELWWLICYIMSLMDLLYHLFNHPNRSKKTCLLTKTHQKA